MSNINIENLSYDMNMDHNAMDAIAGGVIIRMFVDYIKRKKVKRKVAKRISRFFCRRR